MSTCHHGPTLVRPCACASECVNIRGTTWPVAGAPDPWEETAKTQRLLEGNQDIPETGSENPKNRTAPPNQPFAGAPDPERTPRAEPPDCPGPPRFAESTPSFPATALPRQAAGAQRSRHLSCSCTAMLFPKCHYSKYFKCHRVLLSKQFMLTKLKLKHFNETPTPGSSPWLVCRPGWCADPAAVQHRGGGRGGGGMPTGRGTVAFQLPTF